MNEITDERFKEIVDGYNSKEIILGVDVAKGRQFLCDIRDKSTIIWQLLITFVFPICIIGTSIYSFGGWGILYSLIAILFYYSYMGICSMPSDTKRTIYIINVIGLIISFFFVFKISLTLVTTFLSLILLYLFYENIKYEIIKKAITNKNLMIQMFNMNVISMIEKNSLNKARPSKNLGL